MSTLLFTKARKRKIRNLVGLAHERALTKAAGELQSEFERWRKGEIDVFALNDCIHKFHDGIARDLYKFYVIGGNPDWSLAAAIGQGLIQESEVAPPILESLRNAIELARSLGRENAET